MCELAGMPARAALRAVAKALAGAGVPDAAFDARELCRFVTGRDPRLDDTPLTADIAARLAGLAARRAAREPLQYLLGSWDFLDFTLAVGPGVLCPRGGQRGCLRSGARLSAGPMANPTRLSMTCARAAVAWGLGSNGSGAARG